MKQPPLDRILELLLQDLRQRLGDDLFAELEDQRESLELSLTLPISECTREIGRARARLQSTFLAKVKDLQKDHLYFSLGAAFCFRCGTFDCDHSRPASPREIFAGYEKTGAPRFLGLGQYLMESADPRAHDLFERGRSFLTRAEGGESLTKAILTPFRRSKEGLYLHGQVVAGWFKAPGESSERIALSFLLYSHRRSRDRRKYRIQPVFPSLLEELYAKNNLEEPWRLDLRSALPQLRKLDELGAQSHRDDEGSAVQKHLVEQLLRHLADYLDRPVLSQKKKTRHGRKRHQLADRPTSQARRDAAHASQENILYDLENETLVILGSKGRIHIFTPTARLVTSLRLNKTSLNRRIDQKRWRPAAADQVAFFKEALAVSEKQSE